MAQYLVPSSYQSDKLTNNEIGWKTEFLNHRLQFNGGDLPGELGQRPGRLLQPRPGRQHFLQHQRTELHHQGYRDLAGCGVVTRPHLAGGGVLEPEPADQLAGSDQQQPGQPRVRPADHPELRQQRCVLPGHQPVRSDRLAERQCTADPVQPARPLRMVGRRIPPLRAVWCHSQRPLIYAGRLQSVRLRITRERSPPGGCG